jgi:hypothetical protein
MQRTRRAFLAEVGQGMLLASVGPAIASELGLVSAWAAESPGTLSFGRRESLVCLLQETPTERLLPVLAERMQQGTTLLDLVAAAALANARTFGGEDYVGYHSMMALSPSFAMAQELPTARQALPVFKVLYRSCNRIQEKGGRKHEVLHAVESAALPKGQTGADGLHAAIQKKDKQQADRLFAGLVRQSPEDAYNALLESVDDQTEVHRVVLAYRVWDIYNLLGKEEAETLLRQSVHYCVDAERYQQPTTWESPKTLLPRLLDKFRLMNGNDGKRTADDSWVETMCKTIFESKPEQAAEAAAAALAEGMDPNALAEAIILAANQLLLRDPGRAKQEAGKVPAGDAALARSASNKPAGSCHGDSIGVHASDSANAWRNIARVSNPRNRAAALILGSYQAARDRLQRGGDFLAWKPYPLPEHLEQVKAKEIGGLVREAEEAIRANDQIRACAAVYRCGQLGLPSEPMQALMLKYAISEDGALHAEKYYRTATEEFRLARPAFRWRHLAALARVTASEYGMPAPGYDEACKLLKV